MKRYIKSATTLSKPKVSKAISEKIKDFLQNELGFEDVVLCQHGWDYGVEINFWYDPKRIPNFAHHYSDESVRNFVQAQKLYGKIDTDNIHELWSVTKEGPGVHRIYVGILEDVENFISDLRLEHVDIQYRAGGSGEYSSWLAIYAHIDPAGMTYWKNTYDAIK